ncbi:MAG: hypothetical protein NVSMB42_05000 [Herpetosiphon sp.]
MKDRLRVAGWRGKGTRTAPHLQSAGWELVWVTLANVGITIVNIAIGLIVARHFSLVAYGQLSYFINIFGLLRLLASLGLTSQVSFELSRARGAYEPLSRSFYPLLMVRTLTLLAFVLLVAILGYLHHDLVLIIASSAAGLALVDDFCVGALQGIGMTRRVVEVLAFQPLIYMLGAVLVITRNLEIGSLYVAFAVSFIGATLLAAIAVVRAVGRPQAVAWREALPQSFWHFAGNMYLLAIAGTVFTSFATLYLGAVGRFTDAARITIPLNLIFMPSTMANVAMSTVYFPRITESFARNDRSAMQSLFALFYDGVSACTLLITIGFMLFPRVALALLYGTRYQDSATLLVIMAPAAYCYTLQTVLTFTIVAQGRVRAILASTFVPVVALVLGISWGAGHNADLYWFAFAHSVTAVLGFGWQSCLLGIPRRQRLVQLAKHGVVAMTLLGIARVTFNDSPAQLGPIVLVLCLITLTYGLWVWRTIRPRRDGAVSSALDCVET